MGGLSLCIQGTLISNSSHFKNGRFIPVYTGNILSKFCRIIVFSVYPCVYREHDEDSIYEKTDVGLSLCIQGTCGYQFFSLLINRFIPVYTGNIAFILE